MIKICASVEAVAQAAVEIFFEQYKKAMLHSERFSVVLSGGSTPLRTYELLTQDPFKSQIKWSHIHLFWGDERCVPVSDSKSNYGVFYRNFLSKVPIPESQVHPILCDQEENSAAKKYEEILKNYFGGALPVFNFVFLGLGEDGHTASLFPDSSALGEKKRWVVSLKNKNDDYSRITLTPHLINRSEMIVFLVTGKEKRSILNEIKSGSEASLHLPAKLIHSINGKLVWLTDSLANPN